MGRRLGQHFLADPGAVARILAALRAGPEETVVEVGPGRGVLTRPLLAAAGRVVAVELDRVLCARLREELGGRPNFELIEADFLRLDPAALPTGPLKFVGNLPYNVGTAILRRVVARPGWSSAVFMLQKEVADRLLAGPGSRSYGALTIETGLYASVDPVCLVPPSSFRPPPKVDSAVLRLAPRADVPGPEAAERFMRAVHASFRHRRKTILNSLASGYGKAEAAAALERAGIEAGARAETVPPEAFARLAEALG